MRRLWQTAAAPDAAVEAYTVGDDPALDRRLLPYEVYGSLAHAAGLKRIGVLSVSEFRSLQKELKRLLGRALHFSIRPEQEDIHTAVEQHLTRRLGPTGEKLHAGRSRNDQVQTDIRLYLKDELLALHERAAAAAAAWSAFGRRHSSSVMPGYTHLQRAMPTTAGHWAASHAEALLDGARSLRLAFDGADSSPLGSAAGYGVGLPLDRDYTAKLLGFARVQRNTLRVQTSRPRVEAEVVSALALLARDIGALAWDLSLFTTAEFGFFSLASGFTTGSSIMPQKRNPDVVELTRARAALFPGWLNQIVAIGALPSGYHRDFQLTKRPLFDAVDAARAMLAVVANLPGALTVNAARCRAAVTEDLLATEKALALAKTGLPFRAAYRKVAAHARANGHSPKTAERIKLPGYPGSPGDPAFGLIDRARGAEFAWNRRVRERLHGAWSKLVS